jgi:enoyl-CoA hydratase/carnithine racemase
MGSAFSTLLVEAPFDGVQLLLLNRPDRANAINSQMAADLLDYFGSSHSAEGLRCVVIAGTGNHFCAGGDMQERLDMSDAAWRAHHHLVEQAILAMHDCPVPVIAAVHGAAYGGGCELVANSDFAYADVAARFAQTEVRLGIMPGAGGTQNLPRAVGVRRASELLFTGEPFDAPQALEWGLVNRVVPAADLLETAIESARTIAGNAPLAVCQAKKAIRLGESCDRRSALLLEAGLYDVLVPTADRREGIRAFVEKRKPRFEGR